MSSARIRILLADDHDMVRSGIRMWLESEEDMEVVAEARDGEEAIRFTEIHHPDILLIDLHMPQKSGIQVIEHLRAQKNDVRILVMTGYDKSRVKSALDAGADGYLTKEEKRENVLEAIRFSMRGNGAWISPSVSHLLYQTTKEIQSAELTKTERRVLSLLKKSNEEIAEELSITEATVKNHLSNIYFKLSVVNRLEAINWAKKHGLLAI